MPRAARFALAALALLLAVAPATAKASPAPAARLPRNPAPSSQSVRLKLDPDKRSYTGSVRVPLRVSAAVDSVCFHAEGQRLLRVTVRQGADTIAAQRRTGERGWQTLRLARALAPGEAVLEVEFTHLYGTRAVGLYRTVQRGRGYLFTQFESTDAREAFPCWDEPDFKIPWTLTVEIPDSQQVVANTPVASESRADGWRTVSFATSPPLPSYLVALAAGPLEYTNVPGTRVPTRIVTTRGQSHLTAFTAQTTPRLLAALERWFGTPYPFAKLDLIAVPEFAFGAMENPGAITYRDDVILLDPATATVGQRRSCLTTNAHELAHMWFGDLVTMAWWDDLWLNESFADWMAARITDEVYPEYKAGLNDLQRQLRVKAGDTSPATRPIRDTTMTGELGLSNVGLVYSKGNAVLAMFETFLGPATFQKGVRAYLKQHAWGNATAGDLWRALDRASGTNVSAAMATFVEQPGVPLVRVVPIPGGVRLAQSRASAFGVQQPALRWRVPVSLRWSAGGRVRETRVMLEDETHDVKLPGGAPDWVLPDAGGRGWFAWSVPERWLRSLAGPAREALTPPERMGLIANLGLLLAGGDLHGDAYLSALSGFGDDREPQVVQGLIEALGGVRAAFVPDSSAHLFVPYVRRTLGPALERVGFEPRPGEDETVAGLRGELIGWLARRGDDERAWAWALDAARRYLADSTAVDPGVADVSLSLAAARGDAALFDDLRARFETATVPALRRRYLGTLGAFTDSVLEARALEYALSDAVRPTEMFNVMMGFMNKGERAGERLFHWMMSRYEAFAQRLPPPALRFLPLMGQGCSKVRLETTKAFFSDPGRRLPGMEQTLERVETSTHQCIGLREREGGAVEAFLRAMEQPLPSAH
jgi:alanyl aminopeptidase